MLSERKIQNRVALQEYIYKQNTPDAVTLFIVKVPETPQDFLLLSYALFMEGSYYKRKVHFYVPQKSLSPKMTYPDRLKCAASLLQEKQVTESKDPVFIHYVGVLLKHINSKLESLQKKQEQEKKIEIRQSDSLYYKYKNQLTQELRIDIRPDNKQDIDTLSRKWVDYTLLEQGRTFHSEKEQLKLDEITNAKKDEIRSLSHKLMTQKPPPLMPQIRRHTR